MQDSDIIVVTGSGDTSVVVTPQDQVVSTVFKEVSVVAVAQPSIVTAEAVQMHVVTVSAAGGAGGAEFGVFVFNVTPTSSGLVDYRVYLDDTVPASTVLASCTADTQSVRVHVGAAGGTAYSPVVTVDGVEATLTESGTKRWFTGYADILLGPGVNLVSVLSSEGGATTVSITTVGVGPVILDCVFGAYPGTQTELKAGDAMTATVTTPLEATFVSTFIAGASGTSADFPVVAGVANITFTVSALSGLQPIELRARNAFGTSGALFTSTDLTLNQTYPTVGAFTVTYPVGKLALDTGDSADVACSVTAFDTIAYTSTAVTIPASTTYAATKTVGQLGTGYLVTPNYTITANRAANDATTAASTTVKVATVAPTAYIMQVPAGRMVSSPVGVDYEVRIYPDQTLSVAPTLTASHGAWQGAWTFNVSYWKRNLRIDDTVLRGTGTYTSLAVTGLSNLVGSTITSGSTYTVGGFTQRTVTFPAFSRVAPLGVAVADQTKTSAQVAGGAVLTRHEDNGVYANGYYIANADGSYNPVGTYLGLSDSAFAGSNTLGTLQAIVQEVA